MRHAIVAAAVAVALAALALAAPAANATDFCGGRGQVIVFGQDPTDPADPNERHGQAYVAFDAVSSHGYVFSIWYYVESNGERGLQRGGTTVAGDEDVCQDSPNPDQGIF